MKITLTKPCFIRGNLEKVGSTHTVHDGAGKWLIKEGKAKEAPRK